MKNLIFLTAEELELAIFLGLPVDSQKIYLSIEELTYIVDTLGDLFVKLGLNENDEPNELGLKIENLLDTFNRPRIQGKKQKN